MKSIIIAILTTLTIVSCTSKHDNETTSGYTISTESESDKRASKSLSLKGSEDKSAILSLDINTSDITNEPDSIGYFGNTKYDWIITAEASPSNLFQRDTVEKYFNKEWRKTVMDPTIFYLPVDNNKWSFFYSGDKGSNTFRKIAFAWKLYDPVYEPPIIYSEKSLLRIDNMVKKRMEKIKAEKLVYNYSIPEASDVSQKSSYFVTKNNQWAIIVLKAEEKFEGKEIWDVMMSLGLRWGDMDLFHWNNYDLEHGDDQFFSVWTSTEPGYFFPEEIAAGNVQTGDLIFGFSIPRSVAPREVFNVMYEAAEYAQKRLGGKMLDGYGFKLDKDVELGIIDSILVDLEKESIRCGVGDALYLF